MVFTKAFDVKELGEAAKEAGLPLLEKDVIAMTKVLFSWAQASCAIKGGMFAVVGGAIPLMEDQVLKLADKIDPSIDQANA